MGLVCSLMCSIVLCFIFCPVFFKTSPQICLEPPKCKKQRIPPNMSQKLPKASLKYPQDLPQTSPMCPNDVPIMSQQLCFVLFFKFELWMKDLRMFNLKSGLYTENYPNGWSSNTRNRRFRPIRSNFDHRQSFWFSTICPGSWRL